jgi:hypothetical protein
MTDRPNPEVMRPGLRLEIAGELNHINSHMSVNQTVCKVLLTFRRPLNSV